MDIVRMLILADLDKTDAWPFTALYTAANYEQKETARMLIEAGADTSIRPREDLWKTPQNIRFVTRLEEEIRNSIKV